MTTIDALARTVRERDAQRRHLLSLLFERRRPEWERRLDRLVAADRPAVDGAHAASDFGIDGFDFDDFDARR